MRGVEQYMGTVALTLAPSKGPGAEATRAGQEPMTTAVAIVTM